MAVESGRPPLWVLPQSSGDLPSIQRGRPRLATLVSVLAFVGLVPAFVFLAPESRWHPQDLFVVLLCFGFVSLAAAVRLRRTATLDAGLAASLIALALLGPLPAALVFSAPELARWLEGHPTVRFLGNLASFGWGALLASLVLEGLASGAPVDLDAQGYVAIAVAGAVFVAVNYLLTTFFGQVLPEGARFWIVFRQEFVPSSPVAAGLIGAALLTIFLYDQIGIAGLAPLGLILFLPRLLTPLVMKTEPVSTLSRSQATALYASGLADELGLDSVQRRVLADAASHLGGSASLHRLEDFTSVMQTVLYCRERWDGVGGSPGILSGEAIPLESRVLAVANAWSGLTARGTRELNPKHALIELRVHAGTEFDPVVVAAAVGAVAEFGAISFVV
jgi:hypothetical protein